VIIISDLKEKVEVLFQPIAKEQSKHVPEPRPMEEVELQQSVSRDNGKNFSKNFLSFSKNLFAMLFISTQD
jgi:hypothetical protein